MTKTELQLDSCQKKARMVLHWKVISWGQAVQLLILQLGLVCPWTSCFDSESPLWTDTSLQTACYQVVLQNCFFEVNQVFLCITSILTFPTMMFFSLLFLYLSSLGFNTPMQRSPQNHLDEMGMKGIAICNCACSENWY